MTSSSGSIDDRRLKRQEILNLLDEHGLDAVLLQSAGATSWYLEGARTHVSLVGDPVVAIRVSRDADEIFVFENEAERLIDEELLPADKNSLTRVRWDQSLLASAAPATAESEIASALRAARASLLPAEALRYQLLGREVAQVLTDVAQAAASVDSEQKVAGQLAFELVARGIDPVVVLVAGQHRLRFRHPLPSPSSLGLDAMLVVCGRRNGLIANATRWIRWTDSDDDRDRRILTVEAAYFDALRPGNALSDVFEAGTSAYAAAGFDPQEWTRHRQGGAAGYVGRDPRATATTHDLVHLNQAFAWNPSAPGTKVEDTVLLTSDGIETLTCDPRWPSVVVDGRARPDVLRR